jgi:peptide/nickel transport system permease protein
MRRYILRRLLLMLPTLLGVAVLVFLLLRVVPGDIVEMRFAEGQFFNPELVARERARLGLDRPLWRQFLDWLWGIVRLDFGLSMWSGNPIAHEIAIPYSQKIQTHYFPEIYGLVLDPA